jgi:hypothetical protein
MTTDGHLKGSERSHNHVDINAKEVGIRKMSDDKFEKEMVELRVHLNVLMEFLQKYEEDQRYGWTMKKKKVRWHSLQMKLRKRMYARLKEELREAEYEEEVYICELEQGVFFDEEEARDVEERFLDSLMNYWTSSDQHGDMMTEASNEEPYIFYSDTLCMIAYLAGDEQQLDDVLMHVDEEMRLLEEMDEIERFLIEHVFIDLEDGGLNEEVVHNKRKH